METDYMTVRETSKYLKLKPLAVYRMVKDGKIPHLRVGRSIRIPKQRIDTLVRWGSV